ncbi:MAG: hypothetical protein JSV03_03420, partial [Planctomycetota bacterium]
MSKWQAGMRIMLAVLFVGTTFQAGCLSNILRNVNPCGTIIDCDPLEFDLLLTDYPDWDKDPTCTVPGWCGGSQGPLPFPSGGGLVGGGTT